MFTEFFDYFFGPLPKAYCGVFYGLSVLMALFFLLVLVRLLMSLFSSSKDDKKLRIVYGFLLISYFVYYFIFRLLNTMCVNST